MRSSFRGHLCSLAISGRGCTRPDGAVGALGSPGVPGSPSAGALSARFSPRRLDGWVGAAAGLISALPGCAPMADRDRVVGAGRGDTDDGG